VPKIVHAVALHLVTPPGTIRHIGSLRALAIGSRNSDDDFINFR